MKSQLPGMYQEFCHWLNNLEVLLGSTCFEVVGIVFTLLTSWSWYFKYSYSVWEIMVKLGTILGLFPYFFIHNGLKNKHWSFNQVLLMHRSNFHSSYVVSIACLTLSLTKGTWLWSIDCTFDVYWKHLYTSLWHFYLLIINCQYYSAFKQFLSYKLPCNAFQNRYWITVM